MKKILLFVVLILAVRSFAQKPFSFEFDYARYAYDTTADFVEFYYSFNQGDLTLSTGDTVAMLRAVLSIKIQDTLTDRYLVDKNWNIENPVLDTSNFYGNKSLIGILGFIVPHGYYKCIVTGSDGIDSTKKMTIEDNLKIIPYDNKKTALSDIQLCSNIRQDNIDKKSVFYKNTLEVYPNPTMVYGERLPVLYYYSEVYGVKADSVTTPLKLKTVIYDSKGRKKTEKDKMIIRNNNSQVEVGTFNISKYPTDSYVLVLSIADSVSDFIVTSTKRFFIYNPSVKDTTKFSKVSTEFLGSQFNALNDEECDQFFEMGKYASTSSEIDQYEKLDSLNSKREFLYRFWKKRDPDPSTPVNEFYNEYMRRVKLVNDKYGVMNKPGMKTDRGRIYIVYGEPDEIERYPSDLDKKPYEIWHYNQIEGGVIFIFGDVTGFSNYELLHSTKRGEINDVDWMRRITTNQY
jgi:GWxTD domain-containing protein